MKRIISVLIVAVILIASTACSSKGVTQISSNEYDALYEKYISAIDIGMIFNSTWDDANEVEADLYLYYYAQSALESGADFSSYKLNEMYGLIIPEDVLEPFVQSHFDVTTEHLRTNEYYIAEDKGYAFGGLGSAWYCRITNAEQNGKILTIHYDVIGAMEYKIGGGILNIEINGENYKYISNEFEVTAQSYLDYPNSRSDITDKNGVLMMNSGSGMTMGNPELNIHEYSGRRLSDIIYYYENVALPELEAQGSADTEKNSSGWYWSGTYRDGKPLTIDIRQRFGADDYIIAATYEENAGTPDWESYNAIDLSDFNSLYYEYFGDAFYAGLFDHVWTDSFNVDDKGAYVRLYALLENKTEGELRFPVEDVDIFIDRHFIISDPDFVRYSVTYDEESNTYFSEAFTDNRPGARLINVALNDDVLTIYYEAHELENEKAVLWEGEVNIILSDEGYKYTLHHMRYPQYEITQDMAYLEELTKKYVRPLMPAYGIAWYSWETPMDIKASDLISFCAANNILNRELGSEGEYIDSHGTAAEVEVAIQQYFDVTADYLRTAREYNYDGTDEGSTEKYVDEYALFHGFGGGGSTFALNAEQEGDLLKITVGLFGPDDEHPDRPRQYSLLTVKPEGDGFKYISNEVTE